jgi:hypothetical protein
MSIILAYNTPLAAASFLCMLMGVGASGFSWFYVARRTHPLACGSKSIYNQSHLCNTICTVQITINQWEENKIKHEIRTYETQKYRERNTENILLVKWERREYKAQDRSVGGIINCSNDLMHLELK